MTFTHGEDLRENVKAIDVGLRLRKIFQMLLAPETKLIFKKAQFAGAQNMLTKGFEETAEKNFG